MTRLTKSTTPVNWLARKRGSEIDFRLPGDLNDIPSSVMRQRIAEYMVQERARILAELKRPLKV